MIQGGRGREPGAPEGQDEWQLSQWTQSLRMMDGRTGSKNEGGLSGLWEI